MATAIHTCKFHNHNHSYTKHECGHEYCSLYWNACPRCHGTEENNHVQRHSSMDTWRMYQQSGGELEAAAQVLNAASAHVSHHILIPGYDYRNPDARAAKILSALRDLAIAQL
jgi:hypothetical protein